MPHREIRPQQRGLARFLRANQTNAEALLWWGIRREGLHARFRRQHTIGRYIVDFVSLEYRLIVEVDGRGHGGPRDRERNDWLAQQGFHVLRVSNDQVMNDLASVTAMISEALHGDEPTWSTRSTPNPHEGSTESLPPCGGAGEAKPHRRG